MITGALLDRVIERLSAEDSGPVLMSRAADPALREAILASREVREAPVVAGRTVWAAAYGSVVVAESPNWWGRTEEPPPGAVVLDRRTDESALVASLPAAPEDWSEQVDEARRFAKSLRQIAGLHLAHGAPEAPWFVVLQPQPARAVVAAMDGVDGCVATALPEHLAEFPGGIRLTTPRRGGRRAFIACVASFRNAMVEARGS